MVPLPTNLKDAIVFFSDKDVAQEFLCDIRWPKGVVCPTCGSKDVYYISTQRRWKCKNVHPKQQFSVKVGTIFEDSAIGLEKWLPVVWLVTNCKNGISSYELARDLKVTQRTAWFMLHRVRHAMRMLSFETQMTGEVEADETFIGGKLGNMHKSRRRRAQQFSRRGPKATVLGLLEREKGEVVRSSRRTTASAMLRRTSTTTSHWVRRFIPTAACPTKTWARLHASDRGPHQRVRRRPRAHQRP